MGIQLWSLFYKTHGCNYFGTCTRDSYADKQCSLISIDRFHCIVLYYSHIVTSSTIDLVPSGVPTFSQKKPTFSDALKRVLDHIKPIANHHLSHSPLLPIIAHVFLHLLEEWECYVGLQCILTRQGWVDRTSVESTASLLTLSKLLFTQLVSYNNKTMQLNPIPYTVRGIINYDFNLKR